MVTTDAINFTRADYMRLPESYPVQLIDGQLVKEPSPVPWHQAVVLRVRDAACRVVPKSRVLVSPIDVFIDDENVLQPDVLVLAEGDRVTSKLSEVPLPLVVFEVLSPSTAGRDRRVKTRIYLAAGIREVWIVDPEHRTIEVRGQETAWSVDADGAVRSRAIPGLAISPERLLAE